MKEQFVKINNLSIAKILFDFVDKELLKGTNISPNSFWQGFDRVVHELAPKNKKLLEFRETMQQEIDLWHKKNRSKKFDYKEYRNFLIGQFYLIDPT